MKLVFLFAAAVGMLATGNASELTAEDVAANRNYWPKKVTVNTALEAPIFINGKESGRMNLPAGRQFEVKSVTATEVVIDLGGSTRSIPVGDTDLIVQATQTKSLDDQRQALMNAQAQKLAAMKTAATPTPTPTPEPQVTNSVAESFSELVAVDGKKLVPFDPASLKNKKYLAAYYSAAWCGPCRSFTPDLVKWYKRNKSKLDQFDIIFVSADRSAEGMEEYMIEDGMPWPAVPFGSLKPKSPIYGKGGPGIPSLVVFDETGKRVAESYVNGEYVGPRAVLKEFDKLLK